MRSITKRLNFHINEYNIEAIRERSANKSSIRNEEAQWGINHKTVKP